MFIVGEFVILRKCMGIKQVGKVLNLFKSQMLYRMS